MKSSLQKSLTWAVILSESSHIFCCLFPTLFSLLGLLAGAGLIVALPGPILEMHEALHRWEIPMIAFSGVILALGWVITVYSEKVDCHDTGCGHGACAPRKKRAHLVLKVATLLFLANVTIYFAVHRAYWFTSGPGSALVHSEGHVGHDHH